MTRRGSRSGPMGVLAVGLVVAVMTIVPVWGIAAKPICPQSSDSFGTRSSTTPHPLNPCPGNRLDLSRPSIAVAENGQGAQTTTRKVTLWQALDSTTYERKWFTEFFTNPNEVLIGDADSDGKKELIAFDHATVKAGRTRELRIFFYVFEEGSTGMPNAQSPYFVSENWDEDAFLADVDADGKNEIVAWAANDFIIYGHDSAQGYAIEFLGTTGAYSTYDDGDAANLDEDPALEIAIPANDGSKGTVLIWDRQSDGSWTFQEAEPIVGVSVTKLQIQNVDDDPASEIVAMGIDSAKLTHLFIWERGASGYGLELHQSVDLEGDEMAWGFDLADLTGDGKAEIVMGTFPAPGQAMVWTLGNSAWTLLWSTQISGQSNDALIGDADSDAGNTELVFTGVQYLPPNQATLYIEVFAWSPTSLSATSMWTSPTSYAGQEAWAAALG